MKILLISEWYSDNMGYAENFLPKAFGKLGHDVHLVTSNLQVYATSPDYHAVYREKLGNAQTEIGIFNRDNFTLHRNMHERNRFGINIIGLEKNIDQINPDIVYCFEINQPTTALAAKLKDKYKYHLFCESRIHSSIFIPPDNLMAKVKFWTKNKVLNLSKVAEKTDKFYPIAPDVFSNITKYFGIYPEKCRLDNLAVETEIFTPEKNAALVQQFRKALGFRGNDVICVYTGRFTQEKGALILAKAIDSLQKRGFEHIKGLFIGQGEQWYQSQIEQLAGCITHPFVCPSELPNIYHSSDIGVWPLQESTSQLDAMACGLPIIVSDKVEDTNRFMGNGLTFRQNDVEDLAQKILALLDYDKRILLGKIGAERISSFYSWDSQAKIKLNEFELIIGRA